MDGSDYPNRDETTMNSKKRPGPTQSEEGGPDRSKDNDQDYLRQASRLLLAGRLQEARDMLRQGLEHDVGDPKAMSLLGKIEYRLGDTQQAYEIWRSLVNRFPEEGSLWVNLGMAAMGLGQHKEAQEAFERSLKLDPTNQQAHVQLGHLFTELGNRDAARREFMLAGRLSPERPRAWPTGQIEGTMRLPENGPALQVQGTTLVARCDESIYLREANLAAATSTLTFEPLERRAAGHVLSGVIQDGRLGTMMRVTGAGALVAVAGEGRFLVADLDDDVLFIKQDAVFAFESSLAWENGAIDPSRDSGLLPVIRLSGKGRAILWIQGKMLQAQVRPSRPWSVSLGNLVGWSGQITPSLPDADEPRQATFSGSGFVLVDVAP